MRNRPKRSVFYFPTSSEYEKVEIIGKESIFNYSGNAKQSFAYYHKANREKMDLAKNPINRVD
jgi:hypothetical protein